MKCLTQLLKCLCLGTLSSHLTRIKSVSTTATKIAVVELTFIGAVVVGFHGKD